MTIQQKQEYVKNNNELFIELKNLMENFYKFPENKEECLIYDMNNSLRRIKRKLDIMIGMENDFFNPLSKTEVDHKGDKN